MAVMKVAMLCVAAALMCASIKVQRPEMAMALSLGAGALALIWSLTYVEQAVEGVRRLTQGAGLEEGAMEMVFRAAGVALIGEFAQLVCRDAGESALAARVDFCARAALLAMSAPMLIALADQLQALLPL